MKKKCTNTILHNVGPFNKVPCLLIEQAADPVLLNFKILILGVPFDEKILAGNFRYSHYYRNRKCIIIKEVILYRQYQHDVIDFSHLQVILPVKCKDTLMNSLCGQTGEHPGISMIMQEGGPKTNFDQWRTTSDDG